MSGEPLTMLGEAECLVLRRLFAARSVLGSDGQSAVVESFTENDDFALTTSKQIADLLAAGLENASDWSGIDDAELGRIVKESIRQHVRRPRVGEIEEEALRLEREWQLARRDDEAYAARRQDLIDRRAA